MLVDAFQLPWILYYYLLNEVQVYMHYEENGHNDDCVEGEGDRNVVLVASDYKM